VRRLPSVKPAPIIAGVVVLAVLWLVRPIWHGLAMFFWTQPFVWLPPILLLAIGGLLLRRSQRSWSTLEDLRSGVLEVTVVEGKIERFEVTGGSERAQWVRGAFPASPGDLLNLRDLEQGIDQINSLAANNAKLDLRPGSQPGQTVVVVENPARFPVHLYTSLDNSGTRATGTDNASATVSFDSLLGLNELISLTKRQSVLPERWDHKSDSTGLRAVLPFGYNTFSVDASESNYRNVLRLPSGQFLASEGTTISKSFTADRVVYRDQASRISLSARVGTQSSRNWLGGEYLTLADISAAAHLSCLDYLGDVAWETHPSVKEWYALIKCRPAFRELLEDRVPGVRPPAHYTDPDF
jgi:hemolysin activation/secretion protein